MKNIQREILKFYTIWRHLAYKSHLYGETCSIIICLNLCWKSLGRKVLLLFESTYMYVFLYPLFSQREITQTIERNTISVFHDLLHENIHDWRYLHTDRISQNITWHCFPVLNVCTSPTVQYIYLYIYILNKIDNSTMWS